MGPRSVTSHIRRQALESAAESLEPTFALEFPKYEERPRDSVVAFALRLTSRPGPERRGATPRRVGAFLNHPSQPPLGRLHGQPRRQYPSKEGRCLTLDGGSNRDRSRVRALQLDQRCLPPSLASARPGQVGDLPGTTCRRGGVRGNLDCGVPGFCGNTRVRFHTSPRAGRSPSASTTAPADNSV
jgi:hypothetical protein